MSYEEDKVISAQDFLNTLIYPEVVSDLITDRIGIETLIMINAFGTQIEEALEEARAGNKKGFAGTLMIMGFLLKGHIDRWEMAQSIKGNE